MFASPGYPPSSPTGSTIFGSRTWPRHPTMVFLLETTCRSRNVRHIESRYDDLELAAYSYDDARVLLRINSSQEVPREQTPL